MREYLRQVEVEVVDDVGVADRLEAQQFFNARPPVPTDDRRVPWCRLSDAGVQPGLHTTASVAVLELRPVQDLADTPVDAAPGEPPGQGAPDIREAFDPPVVSAQRPLQ